VSSPGWTPRGADLLTATLQAHGVRHVFGMPGTQNVTLFDALRRTSMRTVVASHELAAGFMALGEARITGRPGVLATIPGPGFTYALTALAEARLDSVPLVHLAGAPAQVDGHRHALQAIDQRAMARPVVKAVIDVGSADEVGSAVAQAFALAADGEPGPVLVQATAAAMGDASDAEPGTPMASEAPVLSDDALDALAARVAASQRPLIYAGQGVLGDADALVALATRIGAVIATTTSARGVVPEHQACVVICDADAVRLNALVESADLVLALGVKFSHNAAMGFDLQIDAAKLIVANAASAAGDPGYDASQVLQGDVPSIVRGLLQRLPANGDGLRWSEAELEAVRELQDRRWPIDPYLGNSGLSPAQFFSDLRGQLPEDAVLVTDSGLHQMLARRYFRVDAPRSLLLPSDFQSMGFGLPAAIGAALAAPSRRVVAVVGDGGLVMSGMELLTAVRESIPLLVIVFVDGYLGLIRHQQIGQHGHDFGTELLNPDFSGWARSLGVAHVRYRDARSLAHAMTMDGVVLLEVAMSDTPALHARRVKSLGRETALHLFGRDALNRWRKRRGP